MRTILLIYLDKVLGLLTVGSRTAQSRQQTLRATLDWSYDLLTEPERSLLRRLSVFAGGCLLEAAEQVCSGAGVEAGQVLELLTSLVDKSLVVFEEREAVGGRYRLLEMVRQYGAEGLQASGEAEQVKKRHQQWCLGVAEQADTMSRTREQEVWLIRLESEHANMRAALAWSLKREEEGGEKRGEPKPNSPIPLLLCTALDQFWITRGYLAEGRAWCEAALETEGAQERTAARAKALNTAGRITWAQSDYPASRAYFEESLALWRELGNRQGIAGVLNNLGNIAQDQGDYIAARTYYGEALTINREIGHRAWEAINLNNLGHIARYQGDYAAARANYEESLAIKRELGDRLGIAYTLSGLGNIAQDQGEYAAARACFEESLAINREIGNRAREAINLINLGNIARYQGDYAVAQAHYEESLPMLRQIGDRTGIVTALINLGSVAQDQGEYATARACFEEGLAICREIGHRAWEAINLHNLGNVAQDQGDYAVARRLLEEGQRLFQELGDRMGIAVSLNCLGHVEYDLGKVAAARTLYAESLRLFRELAHRLGVADSLEGLAAVMLELAEAQKAAHLFGASHELRERIGAPVPFNKRANYNRQVEQVRSALGEEAFAAAWEEGRRMTMDEAIQYALEEYPPGEALASQMKEAEV